MVGSTRLERHLEPGLPPYTGGEEVELLLWRFTPLGVAVVVDERFEGLIYRDELQGKMRSGDRLHGRVLRVRDDGKLDITLRRSPREERDEAQELLLESLRLKGGFLPLHDRSSPQESTASCT